MQVGDTGNACHVIASLDMHQTTSRTELVVLDTGYGATPGDVMLEQSLTLMIDNSNLSYGIRVAMCGSQDTSMIFYRIKIQYDIMNCPRNSVVVVPLGD